MAKTGGVSAAKIEDPEDVDGFCGDDFVDNLLMDCVHKIAEQESKFGRIISVNCSLGITSEHSADAGVQGDILFLDQRGHVGHGSPLKPLI